MRTVRFSLRLDRAVKERLDAEAKRVDPSCSWLATRAIEAMLDARAVREKAIRIALVETGKGEFISDEAMHPWVD